MLLKAKKHLEVADMTKNRCLIYECLADVSGHLAAITGSALVTAAMSP